MKRYYFILAAGVLISSNALAQSSRDIKFAKCVAEDGIMDVQAAKVALTKASLSDIKMHAQHMIDDHSKANEELKSLATKKNIQLPTALNDKEQKQQDKLMQLNGKDFDKHYAKCMVKAHKKAICLFKKEAKKGDDPEITKWAEEKVPTLESHLAMWKESCKAAHKE